MLRRRVPLALLAALLLVPGCAAGEDGEPGGTADLEAPSATALEGASALPAADVPGAGPAAELLARVDLSAAVPGQYLYAQAATGGPDGAYVVVTDRSGDHASRLVVLSPAGDGLEVTAAHEIPAFGAVEGARTVAVLPDGSVLVAGTFALPEDVGRGADLGFVVVDPGTGASRQVVVLPARGASSAEGRSVLSADGRTVYTAERLGDAPDGRVVAVDVASGAVVADRDLRGDPELSRYPWLAAAGVAPRAGGGVRVLLLAGTTADGGASVPLLADLTPGLQPAGPPVQLHPEPADTRAALVPGAVDGTAVAVVDVGAGGQVVAVPPGAAEGVPLVRSADVDWLEPQAVDPGLAWFTLPLPWGAASIDLATGESAPPVDTGCREGQGVRWAFPGEEGTTLLLGACGAAELLWVLGT
ncbi:hypothetical protein [Blastococcus sp. SYSU D00813]